MALTQSAPLARGSRAGLLRGTLRANAAFSALCGVAFIVGADALAAALGIPAPPALRLLGVALVGFALALAWAASSDALLLPVGRAAFVLDLLWVAGSALLLAGGWLPLTVAGWWTVALLADAVALFALAEFVGLRRLS